MHCETRVKWPFSGLFFDFRVILTSGGYLLEIAADLVKNGFRASAPK